MSTSPTSLVPLAPTDTYQGPRRSLILAGGGMRVAYQAGVLRALEERGLVFHHADGTSGGTINLAMLFSGHTPREMCDRWRTLNVRDFASMMPPADYLAPHDMLAFGDADGIRANVFPHLGIECRNINAAAGMEGTFNVCNFTRKTNEVVSHRDIDTDLLVAGISLPVFMPPVARGDALYVDSVWIRDANLAESLRQNAEEIWVVWCIGNSPRYRRGIFHQYVHMIELSANGALFADFEGIEEHNKRVRDGGDGHEVRVHIIKPATPLPLDPDLFLGNITSGELIAMGYADASRYLSTMDARGVPLTPEATAMSDTGQGITFRETMAGFFGLGEVDPHQGASKGKAVGTSLAMHATIAINDMDTFIADPSHTGEITGDISFPPFGDHIPATHGVFNLFKPTDEKNLKLMVYEMGFLHSGKPYYLAGRKEVRDDPGFDMWKDTTTLLTTLHETDRNGPVIGAGILTLSVDELMKLTSTMRATNTAGIQESAAAVTKFGKFFMGELWETYVKS